MDDQKLKKAAQKDGIEKMVVGVVLMHERQVLLLKRATSDFMPGLVELPSGGVEENETLAEALMREVFEETHLVLSPPDIKSYIDSFDYESRSGKKTRQFNYLAEINEVSSLVLSQEHEVFYWVDIGHIEDSRLPLSESTKAILDKVTNI